MTKVLYRRLVVLIAHGNEGVLLGKNVQVTPHGATLVASLRFRGESTFYLIFSAVKKMAKSLIHSI